MRIFIHKFSWGFVGAAARPARYLAHASTQKPAGAEKRLPCVGGAVTPSGVTEGVYAIDTVKAIVR